jgi:hypothetical protein
MALIVIGGVAVAISGMVVVSSRNASDDATERPS